MFFLSKKCGISFICLFSDICKKCLYLKFNSRHKSQLRSINQAGAFIEAHGLFITKPYNIANHFNNVFVEKISNLRHDMQTSTAELSYSYITDQIMKDKHCSLWVPQSGSGRGAFFLLLLSINKDRPTGTNNLDGKLLRLVAEYIATPVCHIFNLSLEDAVCLHAWREAKVITLPKNSTL